MNNFKITATKREANVKNIFRKSLQEGFIAAALYNKKTGSESIAVKLPRTQFSNMFNKAQSNTIFEIEIDGQVKKAFIKNYDRALTKSNDIQHVDFFIIESDEAIKIRIPVRTKGLAKGVTLGGVMEVFTTKIEVKCLPAAIPSVIEIDVSDLDIGNSFAIKHLAKIDNVEVLDSPSKTLVAISASAKSKAAATTAKETKK